MNWNTESISFHFYDKVLAFDSKYPLLGMFCKDLDDLESNKKYLSRRNLSVQKRQDKIPSKSTQKEWIELYKKVKKMIFTISLIFLTLEIEQLFAISNKRAIHIPNAFFSNEWVGKSVNQWFIHISFQTIELKGQIAFGKNQIRTWLNVMLPATFLLVDVPKVAFK